MKKENNAIFSGQARREADYSSAESRRIGERSKKIIRPITGVKKITREKEIGNESPEKKRQKRVRLVLISFFAGFLANLIIVSAYFFWIAKYSEIPEKKTGIEENVSLPPSTPISEKSISSPSSDPIPPPSKTVSFGATYAFSGTVISVEGNIITVDMFRCGEGHKSYKMLVTNRTLIMKREKDQENPAGLADIKENYNVAVESFEDIKDKESLEAKKITLMSQNNFNSAN